MTVERGQGWEMHLGDCMKVMPTLGRFDAVVTDPPYGIGEARGKNKSRGLLAVSRDYGMSDWDDAPASPEQIATIRSISTWQIIFGGNYFTLPPTPCWLVWDKLNGDTDFADCELAWTNLNRAVRRIVWQWHGMIRKGKEARDHATQKPVGVMLWCLGWLPVEAKTVLDPFAGSGTTGVACLRTGRGFVGIEKDPTSFALACDRLKAEENGTTLQASRAGQLGLLGGVK